MRYRYNSELLLLWKLIVTSTTEPKLGVVAQKAWPVAEIVVVVEVCAEAMPIQEKVTIRKVTNITTCSLFTESLYPPFSAMQTIYNFSKIIGVPENGQLTKKRAILKIHE
jgi:hypothetical protein